MPDEPRRDWPRVDLSAIARAASAQGASPLIAMVEAQDAILRRTLAAAGLGGREVEEAHYVLPAGAWDVLKGLVRATVRESQEDMASAHGMSKTTLEGHLDTLHAVGFVRMAGEGRRAAYVVTPTGNQAMERQGRSVPK